MKKYSIISAFIFLFTATVVASQPLNENFESFNINSSQEIEVKSSGKVWKAHWKNSTKIAIVENPNKSAANPSNKVLKVVRLVSDTLSKDRYAANLAWRGVSTTSFELPFSEKSCVIELKVLKENGGQVGIRIYPDSERTTQADYIIVKANLVPSPDWQTVRFDFSSIVSKMTSYPRFNFEIEKITTLEAQKPELTTYIDDIRIIEK